MNGILNAKPTNMNALLSNKITLESIRKTYGKLNSYKFFEKGDYNINLGVVRATESITDAFNDVLFLAYKIRGQWQLDKYSITADPGSYWLKNLMNEGGTAIIAEGFYQSAYQLGCHYNTKALVQVRPVRCYRDKDKDSIIECDPKTITQGLYGINIHRHFQGIADAQVVYNSSAGCMVFQRDRDWLACMDICESALDYFGNSFSLGVTLESQWI